MFVAYNMVVSTELVFLFLSKVLHFLNESDETFPFLDILGHFIVQGLVLNPCFVVLKPEWYLLSWGLLLWRFVHETHSLAQQLLNLRSAELLIFYALIAGFFLDVQFGLIFAFLIDCDRAIPRLWNLFSFLRLAIISLNFTVRNQSPDAPLQVPLLVMLNLFLIQILEHLKIVFAIVLLQNIVRNDLPALRIRILLRKQISVFIRLILNSFQNFLAFLFLNVVLRYVIYFDFWLIHHCLKALPIRWMLSVAWLPLCGDLLFETSWRSNKMRWIVAMSWFGSLLRLFDWVDLKCLTILCCKWVSNWNILIKVDVCLLSTFSILLF